MLKKSLIFLTGIFLGVSSLEVYEHISSSSEDFRPQGFPILGKKGFSLQYDSRSKIPLWTQEHIDAKTLKKNADRKGVDFKEDPEIYFLHRSSLKDYSNSGFDRGHMVPAANQRFSKTALEDTFFLSNICPQNPSLNRQFWAHMERYLRRLIKDQGYENIDVTTGPLFLPEIDPNGKQYVTYQVIGENSVAVPTHFFKFVQAEKKGAIEKWAYIVPNTNIPKNKDFDEYLVSLEELEKVSGLILGAKKHNNIQNNEKWNTEKLLELNCEREGN